MKRFKIVFRGYDIEEVDEFIDNNINKSSDIMAEQKTRIFELLEENRKLTEEIEQGKKQQNNISGALLQATAKADQIIAEARILADAEIERVRIFQSKWEFYATKMLVELAPKQRMLYEKLSQRVDEALGKFSIDTQNRKLSAATLTDNAPVNHIKKMENVMEEVNHSKQNLPETKIATQHAIELNEVYDTKESLEDLLNDL
ncbi:MAG: DivIVA domain-containing protein [Clostridia bacterium]